MSRRVCSTGNLRKLRHRGQIEKQREDKKKTSPQYTERDNRLTGINMRHTYYTDVQNVSTQSFYRVGRRSHKNRYGVRKKRCRSKKKVTSSPTTVTRRSNVCV